LTNLKRRGCVWGHETISALDFSANSRTIGYNEITIVPKAGRWPEQAFAVGIDHSFSIMLTAVNDLRFNSLGETWLNLVQTTVQNGTSVGGECLELLEVQVAFSADAEADEVIRHFGDKRMMAEMERVFFADGANALGHSYAKLMRGPGGRHDLEDVISLLRAEPSSKRAVLTLCGPGDGKVPCINVIQFLIRAGSLRTIYFARGQDAFKKFYADAFCLAKMARRVADGLGLTADTVSGFIGSSHVYHEDRAAVDDFLARGNQLMLKGELQGVR
jgi:thymidylate synthase